MNVKFKCRSGEVYDIKTTPGSNNLVLNGGVFKNMDIEPLLRPVVVGNTIPIKYADTENSRKNDVFQYGVCVLTSVEEILEFNMA